ncbi:hypothetical protein J1TS5_03260 [Paenibacillus macerans]|uniref:hypothetical protein n=1 Tax=Paenibacillus macerans TaxID=44252 RepID=UPI001B298D81|nr:hypothetical protein [Paenibacillus macerans]GIP08156.1 hypothetical protein J1TS5_03260 [Paenibacillus macerans]
MDYELLHVGLKHKINNTKDYILFDEIFGCLKGHAYRAAYIINWICIAESLKNKFEEMAKRDGEIAKNVVGVIEDKERNKHPTDRFLLDKAEEYLIIDKEEYLKLENICNLRGVYAHPIGNSPTPDEVVTAVKIGVNAVLSKTPLFKRGYAQKVVKSLFEDLHYIDNEITNLVDFTNKTFLHLHNEAYLYTFEESIKRLNSIIFDPRDNFWFRGLVFTSQFLHLVNEKIDINTSWDLRTLITKYPKASCPIFLGSDTWFNLQEEIKDLIISHSLEPVNDEGQVIPPSRNSIEHIYNLIVRDNITKPRHIERFASALSKVPYSVKKDYNIPLELYFTEIIHELESHDWYRQNPAISVISNMHIEKMLELPDEKQSILGRNILQSADGNANDAKEYLTDIYSGLIYSTPNIVRGIIEEAFINEDGKIRFKTKFMKEALLTLKTVDDEFSNAFLDELVTIIENKEFKYSWITESKRTVKVIQSVINMKELSDIQHTKLNELKDVIDSFEDLDDD